MGDGAFDEAFIRLRIVGATVRRHELMHIGEQARYTGEALRMGAAMAVTPVAVFALRATIGALDLAMVRRHGVAIPLRHDMDGPAVMHRARRHACQHALQRGDEQQQ